MVSLYFFSIGSLFQIFFNKSKGITDSFVMFLFSRRFKHSYSTNHVYFLYLGNPYNNREGQEYPNTGGSNILKF